MAMAASSHPVDNELHAPDHEQSGARRAKRLLIVEAERIVAHDLRQTLEELGYIVVGVAASSKDALQLAERERPDLVLMDIRLAGAIDGIRTAAVLRARFQTPVVYLTANADAATLDRALTTEPGGYLAKPYTERNLHNTIEVALHRHETEQARQQAYERDLLHVTRQNSAIARRADQLQRDATVDPLTGLFNRRYLELTLKRELGLAQRERFSVGLIFFDLDRFKSINDLSGHLAGDRALRAVGDLLRSSLRVSDIACRYGGDEIVIVVPHAHRPDLFALAERLRAGIEQLVIEHDSAPLPPLTASFGVSISPDDGCESAALLQAADAALRRAKLEGRNRVARVSG